MVFDAPRVRGLYGSLGDGWIYLNAPHTQIPEKVFSGVTTAFRSSRALLRPEPKSGSHSRGFSAGVSGAEVARAAARRAIADLLDVRAECVVLGTHSADLVRALHRSIADRVRRSSVVLTSDPLWEPFRSAATVREAQVDLGTGALPAWQYSDVVSGDTRIVALPAVAAHVGVRYDVERIADITHGHARAWVVCDVTHLVPYQPISMEELGIDVAVLDVAPMGGPEIAAVVFRTESMMSRLQSPLDVVQPSAALMGGVAPIVDHYADLSEEAAGTRRRRLRESFDHYSVYVSKVLTHLLESLRLLDVHVVGITGEAASGSISSYAERIPRVSFIVPGVPATTVHSRLLSNGIATTLTPESPLLTAMGVPEAGGSVTVGLAPYNSEYDVDQLARVVASLR